MRKEQKKKCRIHKATLRVSSGVTFYEILKTLEIQNR